MKVAIIGSRDFNDYGKLKEVLNFFKPTKIISGGAKGADLLGEKYANENGIEKIIHYPDWDKHGRGAGFVRNQLIIDDCDVVIAFWDKKSKGTRDSITKAHKASKSIFINYF